MKAAAIYARVSSEQQKEENTIASQTAALVDFARKQGYSVPDDWVIEDEGFSGASLLRPGLERLRDLAAEGYIQAVLIHSPDRLSRKYAYQVLLTEEFARHGVETIFLKAPHSDTPEDQLMLRFQGMIAEYERAQILERSRRGKRHRAKAGEVSVLGGAPYGYRYIRKTSDASARYEIDAAEAEVVRLVYDKYTVGGLSIGAIARLLREMEVPTRRRLRWERSVVWAILRNPAYKGTACFNKTQTGPRQKVTKPFRLSGRAVHGDKSSGHERPRDEWIEIPVPAIVGEDTFALAAGRLADNKRFAPRRTIEPSIVQGLVSCRKCGYALSRSSTRTSARKIHYYRCLGSDAWRHLAGAVCDCRPVRQDLLDQIVWQEVIHLIEDPTLIRAELDRRLDAARAAEPTKRRQEALERELTRIRKSMERLITAYQEDLLSLDELRRRMPEMRAREQSVWAERQAILDQAADQISFLRLAETLTAFLHRLRQSAETLEIAERQKVVRLLVKEVLVDNDTITIRHSIPAQTPTPTASGAPLPSNSKLRVGGESYLLRSRSDHRALRRSLFGGPFVEPVEHALVEECLDQRQNAPVRHFLPDKGEKAVLRDRVEVALPIGIDDMDVAGFEQFIDPPQRVLTAPSGAKAVTVAGKVLLEDRFQDQPQRRLDHPVTDRGDAQRTLLPTSRFGNVVPADRLRSVGPGPQLLAQPPQVGVQITRVVRDADVIHPGGSPVGRHSREGQAERVFGVELVDQTVPFAALDPLFEGRQHPLRPNPRFDPRPFLVRQRRLMGLSGSGSPRGHCSRAWSGVFDHRVSIFLDPLAPPALPGFIATMGPVTPARPTGLLASGSPCVTQPTFRALCLQPPTRSDDRFRT
jgi:site-specific DNA recombinase